MPRERVGHWLQTIDNKGLLRHLRSDALGNRSASTWTARIPREPRHGSTPVRRQGGSNNNYSLTPTSRSKVFLLGRRRHRILQLPSPAPSWPWLKSERRITGIPNSWPRNIISYVTSSEHPSIEENWEIRYFNCSHWEDINNWRKLVKTEHSRTKIFDNKTFISLIFSDFKSKEFSPPLLFWF